jgi:acyl-CoA hydrolase
MEKYLKSSHEQRKDAMQPIKSEPVHSWSFVFPDDINPGGTMFGGKIISKMDMVAGVAASRHCHALPATAAIDAMVFNAPLFSGDRMEIIAKVVWAGKTSMVVKADVFGEHPLRGDRKHCASTHFIFIATDVKHRPVAVPQLLVETETEKREYEIAERIKMQSLERKSPANVPA